MQSIFAARGLTEAAAPTAFRAHYGSVSFPGSAAAILPIVSDHGGRSLRHSAARPWASSCSSRYRSQFSLSASCLLVSGWGLCDAVHSRPPCRCTTRERYRDHRSVQHRWRGRRTRYAATRDRERRLYGQLHGRHSADVPRHRRRILDDCDWDKRHLTSFSLPELK